MKTIFKLLGAAESLGAGFMSKHSATWLSEKLGLGTHQQQSLHDRARTMQELCRSRIKDWDQKKWCG